MLLMRYHLKDEVPVIDGITVRHENNILTVEGSKGKVERNAILPGITIKQEGNKVILEALKASKREKTLINTYKSHLKNMMKGITEGHVYKLKVCSGHFPMSVVVKGQELEVKNFIGEKVPRTIKIPEGVTVKIDGEIITVEGISKETAGTAAARIENMCRRPGFDNRIFQDGIYMIEKDGKEL